MTPELCIGLQFLYLRVFSRVFDLQDKGYLAVVGSDIDFLIT